MRVIYDNIPKELIELDQWILWRLEDGDTKRPYNKHGRWASVTNRADWLSFDEAVELLELRPGYSGLGFCLAKENGLVGIDLDNAIAELHDTPAWAREWLGIPTYAEFSPSGHGVKLLGYRGDFELEHGSVLTTGLEPASQDCRKRPEIAVYTHDRFFTITGRRYRNCGLADIEEPLRLRYLKYFGGLPAQVQDGPDDIPHDGIRWNITKYAVDQMLALEMVDGNDGSRRLLAYACRAVEAGCSNEEGVIAIQIAARHKPFPKPKTPKQILARLKDARQMTVPLMRFDEPDEDEAETPAATDHKPVPDLGQLITTFEDVRPKVIERLRRREGLPCYETGLGLKLMKGEITAIVSGPGIGKTTMAIQMLTNALYHDQTAKALIYEVEMSTESLLERQLSAWADVPADKFQFNTAALTDEELDRIEVWAEYLAEQNKRLAVINNITTLGLQEAVKAWRPSIVLLDYVQRVRESPATDEKESVAVAMEVARRLCRLDMAVLVISSSNRMTGYQQMEMTSFRGSSEVEYGVGFAYGLQLKEKDAQDTFVCRCLKSRYGSPGEPQEFTRLDTLRLVRSIEGISTDLFTEGFSVDGTACLSGSNVSRSQEEEGGATSCEG